MFGLPKVLRAQNLFVDGVGHAGVIEEMTPPKLTRQTEEFRPGGLNAPIALDMGMEMLACELTVAGLSDVLYDQFGTARIDGVQLRSVGSFERSDTGQQITVEQEMRGRFKELDVGAMKTGEASKHKGTFHPVYYRLTIDGRVRCEIDVLNLVERIDGTDRLAEHRAAIL